MKSFSSTDQHAPTEFWLDDFSVFDTTNQTAIDELYGVFYDGWAPLIMASAGVVVMSPDYLGYGQTYDQPKLNGILDMYQQATAISFLKSKLIVESSGCTVLTKGTSLSGYSEGGFAAVIGAQTLQSLGQTILNVDTGGAPFHTTYQFAYAIYGMDSIANFTQVVQEQSVSFAGSFSSKTPDLVNSNVGQNMLNDQWVDLLNQVTDGDLPFLGMDGFLPDPTTDVFNQAFLTNTRVSNGIWEISLCLPP